MRLTVKYEDYKQFKSDVIIKYGDTDDPGKTTPPKQQSTDRLNCSSESSDRRSAAGDSRFLAGISQPGRSKRRRAPAKPRAFHPHC